MAKATIAEVNNFSCANKYQSCKQVLDKIYDGLKSWSILVHILKFMTNQRYNNCLVYRLDITVL